MRFWTGQIDDVYFTLDGTELGEPMRMDVRGADALIRRGNLPVKITEAASGKPDYRKILIRYYGIPFEVEVRTPKSQFDIIVAKIAATMDNNPAHVVRIKLHSPNGDADVLAKGDEDFVTTPKDFSGDILDKVIFRFRSYGLPGA